LQFISNIRPKYFNVQIKPRFAEEVSYWPSLMVCSAAIRLWLPYFLQGKDREWVTVTYSNPKPSKDDWIGVFSPANFNDSICPSEKQWVEAPLLCTAPIKFQFANYTSRNYEHTGKGSLRLQLINQREDFSFALFSGGLLNPKLIAHSKSVTFINPKAPVYPRLAQGKSWNEVLQQGQLVGVILVSYTQVFSGNYGLISCIHTKLGIGYLMVLLFGDISIASKHLLILGKTLCNVL